MYLDQEQLMVRESLTALSGRIAHGGVGGGIYLWGGVGRGKTMLMDEFYDGIRVAKRRVHFHQFFADLHSRAHSLGSMGLALDQVVDGISLLCFDEFHIDDVANAMLMARVLDSIADRDVTLVVTSNVQPHDLLPNPIFHERFVPSIEVLEARLDVIEFVGVRDYRVGGLGGGSDERFASGQLFVDASFAVPQAEAVQLTIGPRTLLCAAIRNRVAWFDFDALCLGSTSATDYLELVERFDEWVVFGVPVLETTTEFAIRRLGNVVDVLYDANVRLTVIADDDLDGVAGRFRDVVGLARLFSRLSLLRSAPGVPTSTASLRLPPSRWE